MDQNLRELAQAAAAEWLGAGADGDEILTALIAGAKKHDLAMSVGAKIFTYDLAAIYAEYAAAIGKEPDDLSASGRQLAFISHVLAQGQEGQPERSA